MRVRQAFLEKGEWHGSDVSRHASGEGKRVLRYRASQRGCDQTQVASALTPGSMRQNVPGDCRAIRRALRRDLTHPHSVPELAPTYRVERSNPDQTGRCERMLVVQVSCQYHDLPDLRTLL